MLWLMAFGAALAGALLGWACGRRTGTPPGLDTSPPLAPPSKTAAAAVETGGRGAERDIAAFLALASHDLQEPLRKIEKFGELLENRFARGLPEEARDCVARMRDGAARMQVLIDELLLFAGAGDEAPRLQAVELERVAAEVVADLQGRIEETAGHVDVGKLPVVDADSKQMRLLLQNLIANSLKFHQPGAPPRVRVYGSATTDAATIVVEDDGIGFGEDQGERIFGLFERVHGRVYPGSGIGLALCRRIVERHGGTIRAEGRPGEGSRFEVTLPVRRLSAEGLATPATRGIERSGA